MHRSAIIDSRLLAPKKQARLAYIHPYICILHPTTVCKKVKQFHQAYTNKPSNQQTKKYKGSAEEEEETEKEGNILHIIFAVDKIRNTASLMCRNRVRLESLESEITGPTSQLIYLSIYLNNDAKTNGNSKTKLIVSFDASDLSDVDFMSCSPDGSPSLSGLPSSSSLPPLSTPFSQASPSYPRSHLHLPQ